MNTKTISIICLAITFVVVFLILFYYAKRKNGDLNTEYDERQVAARGKAYKAGYYAMMLYYALYFIADTIEIEIPNKYNATLIFAGIAFGVAVFTVAAIRSDAYLKMNESRERQIKLIVLLIVINGGVGIVNIMSGEISEILPLNPLVTLLGIVILSAMLIHQKKTSGAEEDDK